MGSEKNCIVRYAYNDIENEKNKNSTIKFDLKEVPVDCLRPNTRRILSKMLNSKKILPTEEGYYRDWRGLRYLCGVDSSYENMLNKDNDPTGNVLALWSKDMNVNIQNLQNLQDYLGKIDRWDVVDDTSSLFCKYCFSEVYILGLFYNSFISFIVEDARIYLTAQEKLEYQSQSQHDVNDNPVSDEDITGDDIYRRQYGLPLLKYDAYVLYADQDFHFAMTLMTKMEEMGFKLCVKNRDLVSADFVHETIIQLITHRCRRLIVILSPAFIKSSHNKFFLNYAQGLAIGKL